MLQRFWRGDASRHRQTGGSGLGLAIVASIVAAHGGTSDVISTPGAGTTIRIRLPVSPTRTRPAIGLRSSLRGARSDRQGLGRADA